MVISETQMSKDLFILGHIWGAQALNPNFVPLIVIIKFRSKD
jgi:hypothetical protein